MTAAQRIFGHQDLRWDGHLTDMVNLTRAKDAALSLALADLNTARGATFRRAA
jgi:hypothetical protein